MRFLIGHSGQQAPVHLILGGDFFKQCLPLRQVVANFALKRQ